MVEVVFTLRLLIIIITVALVVRYHVLEALRVILRELFARAHGLLASLVSVENLLHVK